jgi:site-specific recombinase XerC
MGVGVAQDGSRMAPSTLKSQWCNWVARQKIDPHQPIHGLRDSFGTWVYETSGSGRRRSGSGTPTRRRRSGTTCA